MPLSACKQAPSACSPSHEMQCMGKSGACSAPPAQDNIILSPVLTLVLSSALHFFDPSRMTCQHMGNGSVPTACAPSSVSMPHFLFFPLCTATLCAVGGQPCKAIECNLDACLLTHRGEGVHWTPPVHLILTFYWVIFELIKLEQKKTSQMHWQKKKKNLINV